VGAILNDHDLRLQRPLCDTETKRTSVGMKRRIEKDSLSFLILAMARKTTRCWVETYRPILSTMFPDLCLDHRGLRKEKGWVKRESICVCGFSEIVSCLVARYFSQD
jgi:hypothetical protein